MKYGLAFSGGKDSLACLLLYLDQLEDITVMWANPGKNYPEMLALVELVRDICPNFVEIKTDRVGQNAREGIPADVVPVRWTRIGMQFTGPKPVMVQNYMQCCFENISHPFLMKARELGITHMIRGQRNAESHKSPLTSGMESAGITYIHPIENWTTEQVLDFIAQHMPVPAHFSLNHTSMDCYDCTAYTDETQDRVAYTERRHPEFHKEYLLRKTAVDSALREAMSAQGV